MPSQSQCPSIMFIDRITHGLNGNALPPCGDESAGSMSKFLEQHQSFPPYSVHSCSILDNPNGSKWRNEQNCPSRIPPNIKHRNVSCFAAMQSPNLTRDQHVELHSIRRRELVAFWMTWQVLELQQPSNTSFSALVQQMVLESSPQYIYINQQWKAPAPTLFMPCINMHYFFPETDATISCNFPDVWKSHHTIPFKWVPHNTCQSIIWCLFKTLLLNIHDNTWLCQRCAN